MKIVSSFRISIRQEKPNYDKAKSTSRLSRVQLRVFETRINLKPELTSFKKIKGPDNPTSQLVPIMSIKGCSGDGEGRKDKGGGEGSRS
jgi:hypothetical protein